MAFKLGKKPARPGAVKLRLANYIDTTALPKPPLSFGHERLVNQWGMLANDQVGDCVIAGGLHEVLMWNKEAGRTVRVDDACAIRNYSAITGYNPDDPDTDQGTDMELAARYRRRTGLVDADGKRHKIGAYVALEPGDVTQLWYALYLFDAVGIGVEFPSQWMDAFNHHKVWGQVAHPNIEGGHYIAGCARRNGGIVVVTWGTLVHMTIAGYHQFCDEAIAYLSEEKLVNGVDSDGFSLSTLRTDLGKVASM